MIRLAIMLSVCFVVNVGYAYGSEPSIEQIASIHESVINNNVTLEVKERIEHKGQLPEDGDAKVRDRAISYFYEAYGLRLESSDKAYANNPRAQERAKEHIINTRDRSVEAVKRGVVVRRINLNYALDRSWKIDFAARKFQQLDNDLRDLDALMKQHQLEETDRASLSKHGGAVFDAHRLFTFVDGGSNKVAYYAGSWPHMQEALDGIHLGLLPPWVWSSDIHGTTNHDENIIEIKGRDGTRSFKAELAGNQQWRALSFTVYNDDGEITKQIQYDDYRFVDNVPVPHQIVVQRYNPKNGSRSHAVHHVEQVIMGGTWDESVYRVPNGYKVSDQLPIVQPGKSGLR